MKKFKYNKLEEELYIDKLDNGLTVCVIPSKKNKRYYAVLGTKYGSGDIEFIPIGKKEYRKTSYGVAHFLEHKAFEMKNGIDPFTYFLKSGTNANASTSYEVTKYYIWGVNKPYQNINYLLTFLFSPYFTKENISKEQGIIGEEIMMYDDEPMWIIDDLSRKALFNELPIREKIAGTKESIANITEDELYDCFNTFYVPNNMFLVVGGNVEPEKIIDLVKENTALNKIKPNKHIQRKEYVESALVKSEFEEACANVFIPKVRYNFKIDMNKFSIKDRIKLHMYFNMIESLVFGSTSLFYEIVHKEKYVNDFYVDHNYFDNFYIMEFTAESDKADLFKDEIDKTLDNLQISAEDLERMKKVWIASEIRISDNIDLMVESAFDDFILYDKVLHNRIDIIKSLNIQELNDIIKELDLTNKSFVLINPKNT